jgi:ribosomal-protein-alanine N-acetyltransferase
MFPPTLTTERLVLRPPRVEDAASVFERYGSDSAVTRYLSWKTHASVADAEAFLRKITDPDVPCPDTHWAICYDGDTETSGMFTVFGSGALVALGYVLRRSLWGKGLVAEALRAVQQQVWRDLRVWRLQALAHVENRSSQRVMEKCGLRFEGVLRRRFVMPQLGSEPQDCCLYAQVRDDL